jgi:DNA-binding SARP family transcriptional activator
MLRIRLLGALGLEIDGDELTPPDGRPARGLLGWLALHPGLHARSRVAAALWPDTLDSSARGNLRGALFNLRSALGPSGAAALVATREQVGFEPGAVWVDAVEFDALLAAGRSEEALELCRGDLLPELDDEWVLAARDAHHDRRGDALAALADAAPTAEDALPFARRRVALDPLDEPAHRDLMMRLAAAGDRGGALVVYQRLAERLRRELAVPPSAETRALAAELRDEPAPAPAAPAAIPTRLAAARRRGALVGRDDVLGRLRALWAGGESQVALLAGEAGIGKTRLVAELAHALQAEGATVLYGRAEEDALVPYQPFAEALRDAPNGALDDVAALVPDATEPDARARLFDAVAARLAGPDRLLVLDDLHWADRPTLRLLLHLAGRPELAPRLLAIAYRPGAGEPLDSALADLRRELPVQRVALGGLDDGAVAAMVERAGRAADPELVRALAERTNGNPFFVEELLRAAAGDELPEEVTQAVTRRVHALGAEAGAILAAGALSGPEFELEVVAEVLGLPAATALDVLDAAVRARLVAEVPDVPGRFAFVHALVRDALTGTLTAARRARLHGLLAAALEPRAEADAGRYLAPLAHHALEAGADPARAVDLAERAAARAAGVFAFEDAAGFLERAAPLAADARRAELLCALGEALQRAGATARAAAAFAEASDLARAAGTPDVLARAALGSGGVGVTILRVDEALVGRLDEALAAEPGDEYRARLLARLGIELAYDPDEARREAASREAVAVAERVGDPATLAAALNARHVALWGPDHTRERLEVADAMLAAARQAGDRELELQARHWRVLDRMEVGDGAAVMRELDDYAALAADVRLLAYSWYVPVWRSTLAILDGRAEEAVELARHARELGRRAGDANAEVFWLQHRWTRAVAEGQFATSDIFDIAPLGPFPWWVRLHELLSAGEDYAPVREELGAAWRAYTATFAWYQAAHGELDLARRAIGPLLADGLAAVPRDVNLLATYAPLSEAVVALSDAALGRELMAAIEPYAELMIVIARGSSHAGSAAYFVGRAASAAGDDDTADDAFAEAARRDERAGAPWFVVRDLWARAALRVARGDRRGATPLLDRALEIVRERRRDDMAARLTALRDG